MPFPSRSAHSLSHVRYTPHYSWIDTPERNPYDGLQVGTMLTKFEAMRRDAQRFVPELSDLTYLDSLFEVKTVLASSESNDGRPILFEKPSHLERCYNILGGKLDNVYDALRRLDGEVLVKM